MKIILIQISPGVIPKGPIHSRPILVLNSVWLDTEQMTSRYLNNWWPNFQQCTFRVIGHQCVDYILSDQYLIVIGNYSVKHVYNVFTELQISTCASLSSPLCCMQYRLSTLVNNYIYHKVWDVITHSFPNFKATVGNGWVLSSHTLLGMLLLIHAGVKVNIVMTSLIGRAHTWTDHWNYPYRYRSEMPSRHYCDVIMGAMAPQITSLTVVYSTVYSSPDKKKTSKLRVTGLCLGNSPVTGEFPVQRVSNAENVSIWWRHHDIRKGADWTLTHQSRVTINYAIMMRS